MSDVHLWGDSTTERQARLILPILVRQVLAGQSIFYGQISDELSIGHSYLGNHLGTITDALNELARQWGTEIPPLPALVVRKDTGLPGDSFGYNVPRLVDYGSWPKQEKFQAVAREHAGIFAYRKWPDVLAALGLPPVKPAVSPALVAAARVGVLEGEAHRRLKEYVAANPRVIGQAQWKVKGIIESRLPSADTIDVLFQTPWKWLAVEVKAANAEPADLLRGLFQCVKYRALLEAEARVTSKRVEIASVLVLEGKLPDELLAARNTLGVAVFEGVVPD